MSYLNEGEWDPGFIKEVKFNDWLIINPSLRDPFKPESLIFPVKDWVNPNNEMEILLVNRTIKGFFDEYGVQTSRDVFKGIHAHVTMIKSIIYAMCYLWGGIIKNANFDTSGYLDSLIRTRLMMPPDYGIGYLCLMIASQVKLSQDMLIEIESSRDLTPELSYTPDELAILKRIVRKEIRLRLALCIARELGYICNKLRISQKVKHELLQLHLLIECLKNYQVAT
jgi:hypothetical protein